MGMANPNDNLVIVMPKPDGLPVLPESQCNFFLDLVAAGVQLENAFFVSRGKVAMGKDVERDELAVSLLKLQRAYVGRNGEGGTTNICYKIFR